jgi:hypothetical protein
VCQFIHALHHRKRYMYALSYKKFLLYAITGLSKQDHVLAEPTHRGSVDSVQTDNMYAHNRHQNVLLVERSTRFYKLLSSYLTWAPTQAGLFASKTHSYKCTVDLQWSPPSVKLSWVVFILIRFPLPIPRLNTCVITSAILRGRMCCNTQSRSIHKNIDSHCFPAQESNPWFKKDPRSYPLKISSGFKIVSLVELAFQSFNLFQRTISPRALNAIG